MRKHHSRRIRQFTVLGLCGHQLFNLVCLYPTVLQSVSSLQQRRQRSSAVPERPHREGKHHFGNSFERVRRYSIFDDRHLHNLPLSQKTVHLLLVISPVLPDSLRVLRNGHHYTLPLDQKLHPGHMQMHPFCLSVRVLRGPKQPGEDRQHQ